MAALGPRLVRSRTSECARCGARARLACGRPGGGLTELWSLLASGPRKARRRSPRRVESPPSGRNGTIPYTPAMRRWVCIVALLAGFSADGYAYTVRSRRPVPIERTLDEPALARSEERRVGKEC